MSRPNLLELSKLDIFEIVTISPEGEEISCIQSQVLGLREYLSNSVVLNMVAIPEGSFNIGSPEHEAERYTREGPLHHVKLKSFYLSQYPITQSQWYAVAQLPPVKQELNPTPSLFSGDNLPVEQVSWLDIIEFCDRLSRLTGKSYRLPSESEWEYACRAGTTTPFHFGETISPTLANYFASSAYGAGAIGYSCKSTTVVGFFLSANAFGLYDMHGNVYEWCADSWHCDYQGAPTDGSVWEEHDDKSHPSNYSRVIRGGAWNVPPKYCRSAFRSDLSPRGRFRNIGFRVALSI